MKQSKKNYYYKITSKRGRPAGGYNVVATVYSVKLNKIHEIGEVKWNTASFKGEKSVVYDLLKNKKLIPTKEYNANGGYYIASRSSVVITEL